MEHLSNTELQLDSLETVNRAMLSMRDCQSVSDLVSLVRSLIQYFGLDNFVFVSMLRGNSNRESFRYVIGCRSEWCQLYNAKNWQAIDPFLEHAQRSSTPILGSEIQAESAGQTELLAAAAAHGFRSGIAIPAHAGAQARIGVLYLGSEREPADMEPSLMQNRTFLRTIAMELYEWWQRRLQIDAMVQLKFDSIDLTLLRREREGYTSEDIRRMHGFKISLINHRFRRINQKLEVHSKKLAVEKASMLGVLQD